MFTVVDKLKRHEPSSWSCRQLLFMQPSASEIYYFATTSTVGPSHPLFPTILSLFLFSFLVPLAVFLVARFISPPALRSLRHRWRILRGARIPLYCKTPEDFGGNEKPADIHVAVPDSSLTENLDIGKLSRHFLRIL